MKSLVGLLILSKYSLDVENCIYKDINFNKIFKLIKKFTRKNYRTRNCRNMQHPEIKAFQNKALLYQFIY